MKKMFFLKHKFYYFIINILKIQNSKFKNKIALMIFGSIIIKITIDYNIFFSINLFNKIFLYFLKSIQPSILIYLMDCIANDLLISVYKLKIYMKYYLKI